MSGIVAVDLDDPERKAQAAGQDEWEWIDGVLEGKHTGQVVLFGNVTGEIDEPDIIVSVPDAEHIAANSPSVTLALIARIRELEEEIDRAASLLEAKSDLSARRHWAAEIRKKVGR